jgi:hypothetical protein
MANNARKRKVEKAREGGGGPKQEKWKERHCKEITTHTF